MDDVRVVLADDDEAMLAALRDVLDGDARVRLVGAVGSGPALLEVVRATRPEVVVLDVGISGEGAEIARVLRAGSAPPAVVAVSARTDRETVVELLRAGASCYLAKDRIGASLGDVVVRAAQGEVVLAVGIAAGLLRDLL